MVEGIVKKIMMTGITKYSKAYEVAVDNVQIKVTNQVGGTVNYEICKDFKAVEPVRFIQIMDKKMDIFQYESLANPFLKKSLESFAKESQVELESVSCFILKHGETIGLSFYSGFKNMKNILLAKHLAELGI